MPRSPRGAALLLGLLLCVAVRRGSAAEDSGDLTSYQASIDSLVELARTAQASAALKQQENAALLKENNILRDALVEASSQAGSCQSTSRPPEPSARGQRTPWHELSDAPFGMVQALWQVSALRGVLPPAKDPAPSSPKCPLFLRSFAPPCPPIPTRV